MDVPLFNQLVWRCGIFYLIQIATHSLVCHNFIHESSSLPTPQQVYFVQYARHGALWNQQCYRVKTKIFHRHNSDAIELRGYLFAGMTPSAKACCLDDMENLFLLVIFNVSQLHTLNNNSPVTSRLQRLDSDESRRKNYLFHNQCQVCTAWSLEKHGAPVNVLKKPFEYFQSSLLCHGPTVMITGPAVGQNSNVNMAKGSSFDKFVETNNCWRLSVGDPSFLQAQLWSAKFMQTEFLRIRFLSLTPIATDGILRRNCASFKTNHESTLKAHSKTVFHSTYQSLITNWRFSQWFCGKACQIWAKLVESSLLLWNLIDWKQN